LLPSALAPRHLAPSPTRRSSDLAPRTAAFLKGGASAMAAAALAPGAEFTATLPQGPIFANPSIHHKLRNNRVGCQHERHKDPHRSEEHTSELQSRVDIVCRLLLE